MKGGFKLMCHGFPLKINKLQQLYFITKLYCTVTMKRNNFYAEIPNIFYISLILFEYHYVLVFHKK